MIWHSSSLPLMLVNKPTAIDDFPEALNPNGIMSGSPIPILTAGGSGDVLAGQ